MPAAPIMITLGLVMRRSRVRIPQAAQMWKARSDVLTGPFALAGVGWGGGERVEGGSRGCGQAGGMASGVWWGRVGRLWGRLGAGLVALGQAHVAGALAAAEAEAEGLTGPGSGHPERMVGGVGMSAVERGLWSQLADLPGYWSR
ncbi:DUF6059 family protein [Kitasatospora sp. NPDC004669]|uniref:DUF6059 family protein n=1 Tax=Kitasatospora sp. NPDC004669 TaxID=3154555 RepID=UPI00339F1F92